MELSSKKYKRVILSQVLKIATYIAYKENHIIVNSKLFCILYFIFCMLILLHYAT